MYTRSRQSQNFTGNQQQQRAGGNMQQQQQRDQYQQQSYNQHGNYQGGNQNQQNYNQGGAGTPYKQQPQQQQQQPPTPLQHSTPQPQRLKPILKSSGGNNVQGTPVQGQNNQQYNQNQNQQQNFQPQQTNNGTESINEVKDESIEGDAQEVPKWRRKIPGLKVNRKLKRLRMNQRLRKTIQPKNAIMVLNEMKTGVQFTFPETQTALPNSLFLVHAEIEGKTYIGQGISKPLARQNAAENALKSLLLEKMTAAAMKARVDGEPENENSGNTTTNADANTGEAIENQEGETKMETEESDEIPWSSLASFALYKLFLEWQNQGTFVPVPRPGVPAGKLKKEQPVNKPVVPKELPANATSIHPVMLLNQMRPGLTYHEVSRVGNPPNTMFTLGVDVDGQEFTGAAKNKKDAKKMAAKAALHGLYDLTYPEEKEGEDVNMG